MAEKKVWLITGAGRGMGVDIANAVLGTRLRPRSRTTST
jgi:NAD(P)-dependent dehydrogenase (short-subunit alcohol dehydrogenase family)